MPNFSTHYYLDRHETLLHQFINQTPIPAVTIKDAMLYALFPGGKRLRPMLVYLSGALVGANLDSLDVIAAAIELIHCYSLIHDDLPAMDNDDLRRGKASCHRAFDEATAILVGDAMQALAVDLLLSKLPTQHAIPVTRELVRACGPCGMVSGQSLDLSELAKPKISESELLRIHQLKTGKLISASINMALYAADPAQAEINALQPFAEQLGIVFQMQDDYLDRYGDVDDLGKGRASDTINQKTTFANLYSKHELLHKINDYYVQAKSSLHVLGEPALPLLEFVDNLEARTNNTLVTAVAR